MKLKNFLLRLENNMISRIIEVVVESIDAEFHVKLESDDGGSCYNIYLPWETKTNILRKKLGEINIDKRFVITFVPEGYIGVFLRDKK